MVRVYVHNPQREGGFSSAELAREHAMLDRALKLNLFLVALLTASPFALHGAGVLTTDPSAFLPLAASGFAIHGIAVLAQRLRLVHPRTLSVAYFAAFTALSVVGSSLLGGPRSTAAFLSFFYPVLTVAAGFQLTGAILLIAVALLYALAPMAPSVNDFVSSSTIALPLSPAFSLPAVALLFAGSMALVASQHRRLRTFTSSYRSNIERLLHNESPVAAAREAASFLHAQTPLRLGIYFRRPGSNSYLLSAGDRFLYAPSVDGASRSFAEAVEGAEPTAFEQVFFTKRGVAKDAYVSHHAFDGHDVIAVVSKPSGFLPEDFYLIEDVFTQLRVVVEATLVHAQRARDLRVGRAYEEAERLLSRVNELSAVASEIHATLDRVYNVTSVVVARLESGSQPRVLSASGRDDHRKAAIDALGSYGEPRMPAALEMPGASDANGGANFLLLAASPSSRGPVTLGIAVYLANGRVLQAVDFENVQRLAVTVASRVEAIENYEEAQHARMLLSTAIDSYPDPVAVVDEEAHVLLGNRALRELATVVEQHRQSGARPSRLCELIPGFEPCSDAPSGEPDGFRQTAIELHAGDETRRYFVRSFPFKDTHGRQLFFILFEDVTRVAELEDALVRTGRLAQIGEVSSYVTHNINNALSNIVALAHLAMPDHPEAQETLEHIVDQAMQIRDIVRKTLIFASSHRVTARTFNASDVVERAVGLYSVKARSLRVGVSVSVANDFSLEGDFDALLQAVGNLVDNAVDAAAVRARGGLVEVIIDRNAGEGRITIRDNGPGIPESLRERVLDPFFTTKPNGTGLGLPFAKRAVEEAGGALEVQSVEGEGTSFIARFPARH